MLRDHSYFYHSAMTSILDESVGKLISALDQKNMMEESFVVFMSDVRPNYLFLTEKKW